MCCRSIGTPKSKLSAILFSVLHVKDIIYNILATTTAEVKLVVCVLCTELMPTFSSRREGQEYTAEKLILTERHETVSIPQVDLRPPGGQPHILSVRPCGTSTL